MAKAKQLENYLSAEGAYNIAMQLRDYWRKEGYTVDVRVEADKPSMIDRGTYYIVRSNMVNGVPPGYKFISTEKDK